MSRKLALIIGNSEYHDPGLAQLKSPGLDAYDLAGALRSPEIGAFDEVATLINETEAAVRRAIARFFVNRKPDDLLLLYFSGHGVRDDQGQLHLAVKDTDRALLSATAIPAAFVTGQMDLSRSRRQVLILDCCNSGAFDRATKSGGAGSSMGTATAFEGVGYGRVVLTASDSTQYAWEGDAVVGEAANSVFTRYLVQGLETGEADADSDGLISLDEWYDYVYAHVIGETPRQTPGKWSYKQQGELIIAKNPKPRAPKQAELPVELRQAIESPFTGVREGAARELGHLLTGSNAALAQAAREALQKLAEDDSRRVSLAARGALDAEAEAQRAQQREREERERLAAQRAEEERRAREAKRAEEERLARERAEAERIAKQRAEDERLARERAEQERLAQANAEQQRLAQAKAEREARQTAEEERQARERAEPQAAIREKAEAEQSAVPQVEPPPRPKEVLGAPAGMDKPWLPLTVLALGAWFSVALHQGLSWNLAVTGASDLTGLFLVNAVIWGAALGGVIWAGLRLKRVVLTGGQSALLVGGWALSQVVAVAIEQAVLANDSGLPDEGLALGMAVAGLIGGVSTGAALWRAGRAVWLRPAAIITAGWAVGWIISAVVGLSVVNAFGDDPGYGGKELMKAWFGLDSGAAEPLGRAVVVLCFGAAYALAGLIGGQAMFTQLKRPPEAEPGALAPAVSSEIGLAAYGAPWLTIVIGWALAWLILPPIAYFALRDAAYGFGAPLASAACAVVTLWALRRFTPSLNGFVMASLALGWGLAAVYAEILTTHVFHNLLSWDWGPSDLTATLLTYAARGSMIACLFWGLRLRGRRLPALGLAFGFAAALYLTDWLMRQAVFSSGFYYSIQDGASSWLGEGAVLLSDAIAGGMAGGVTGALCGALVLGTLYWVQRRGDAQINSHVSRLGEFFAGAARPLVLITLGWVVARALEAGLFYFITRDGYSFDGLVLIVVFTWALSGVIGGLGVWRALSQWAAHAPGLHWKLAATWAVAWAIGAAIHLLFIFLINEFGWPLQGGVTFALASLVVGALGGNVTARLLPDMNGEQRRWITLGWALAWMCAALASSYSATEQGWWFAGLIEGLTGGWLGGAAMLWQISRARRSSGN